jgi:hypothetical protein
MTINLSHSHCRAAAQFNLRASLDARLSTSLQSERYWPRASEPGRQAASSA